jgi:hypothetical protein
MTIALQSVQREFDASSAGLQLIVVVCMIASAESRALVSDEHRCIVAS